MSKDNQTDPQEDQDFFTLPAAELQAMLSAKTQELAQAHEDLAKLKTRSLSVYEENTQLKASENLAEQQALLDFQLRQAQVFVDSGAFPKGLNPHKAYTLIKAGEEMGMGAIESLNSLYVVNGQIKPWGKAKSAPILAAGYHLEWLNESTTQVTVRAIHPVTGHVVEETVSSSDKVLKNSKAMGFAPRQKLRYHALGMLMAFHFSHLFRGASDPFDRPGTQEGEVLEVSTYNVEAVSDKKEQQRLLSAIAQATSPAELHRLEHLRHSHDLGHELDDKYQQLKNLSNEQE